MRDEKVSQAVVIAGSMWAAVLIVALAGLAFAAAGMWNAAILTGLFDGILAPAAAVAHVRCYAMRLASMVRRLHGIEVEEARATDHMRVT